ncbi:MAG: alpha/beta hydrolase [Pseudodesulfovibrio sp.]|uniref:alpha/beta hydrolase n=1 Tax=Pseudodesulfovibrio sp. TaxID=2035812 RepID=UPI003D0AD029
MKLLLGMCAGYALLAAWIYFSQRGMVYCPRRELVATPGEIGLECEDVRVRNRLGTDIHGWWLPCGRARLTLLFCHGNGGNISHRLESLRIFHDLGLSVLLFDYSGYGQSGGEPSEAGTYADARACWDWLMDRGTDPGSVVLFGRSLGGGVAARLARELADEGIAPAGIILESTFTSVPDMGAYMYPWLPVRRLSRFRYDSAAALAGLDLPGLFLHSPDDDVVPYALGKRLYEGYAGQKTFFELSGDHNKGFLDTGEPYANALARFLSGLGGQCR